MVLRHAQTGPDQRTDQRQRQSVLREYGKAIQARNGDGVARHSKFAGFHAWPSRLVREGHALLSFHRITTFWITRQQSRFHAASCSPPESSLIETLHKKARPDC